MKKYTPLLLILIFLMSHVNLYAQKEKKNILNAESIIDNYIKSIGGIKKLQKVKSLQKKVTIELKGLSSLKINSEIIYQSPNLYYSYVNREIADLKQVYITKYNGKNCTITQIYNDNETNTIIHEELLKEKIQDFYPFPILTQKLNDTKFELKEIIQDETQKIYKILQNQPDIRDSIFLYFDSKEFLLRKKEKINPNNTTIIEYYDYTEYDDIIFPFRETKTIIINGKNAQSSSSTINQITINKEHAIDIFE